MKYVCLSFLLLLSLASCEQKSGGINHFHDSNIVTIARLQDQRTGDSLIHFLSHQNPTYRRLAVLAFGSIQDSTYVKNIGELIQSEQDSAVLIAAAFSLGQTPCAESKKLLEQAVHQSNQLPVKNAFIEAYGKVARTWDINVPADTYSSSIAWAIYRMGLRGNSSPSLNAKAGQLLQSSNFNTRLAAAHYFSRGAVKFDSLSSVLIDVARNDSSEIRMAATLALKKINTKDALQALQNIAINDTDYRVRVNAVRALEAFNFNDTKTTLIKTLSDDVLHVAIAASETIKNSITDEGFDDVLNAARAQKQWRVQANLYEAALSVSKNPSLADEIISLFNRSENNYQRAALLIALSHSVKSFEFLVKEALQTSTPVIKTSAATALTNLNRHADFSQKLRKPFVDAYKQLIADGDAAVTGIISDALQDSTLQYKSVLTDISFLKDALARLSLPKDFEAVAPLKSAIAYFENTTYTPPANAFNHPISWDSVKQIPADQKAVIHTTKGDITIRLLVEEAPGSVMNFVTLASAGYYKGKNFHRVVPNFVVQGGCPRGDGWGSEDYSIRSEFSLRRYRTGSMGMASAGKDTEGTQWFITHSPTPHLDGRYTIFAEVAEGIGIVHLLEVGDQILSIDFPGLQF